MITKTTNDKLDDKIEINNGENTMTKIAALDLDKVTFDKSPNQSARSGKVEYIVLHHTGPGSTKGIVSWLKNPVSSASAHFVLGTDGELVCLVDTSQKSWHAGKSSWEGKNDINKFSVGIEICNCGIIDKKPDGFYYMVGTKPTKYTGTVSPVEGEIVYPDGKKTKGWFVPYPDEQIEKLVALCKALVAKYPAIVEKNIITHYMIAQPFGRKNDPFGLNIDEIKDMIFK